VHVKKTAAVGELAKAKTKGQGILMYYIVSGGYELHFETSIFPTHQLYEHTLYSFIFGK
jgi:hypothetical protein